MVKAQKGDLIRIVKEKRYGLEGTEDFVLGAIYEVDCIDYDGDINFTDNRGASRYLSDTSMYEIHRKAGEEDAVTVPVKATLHSREKVLSRTDVEVMLDAVNPPHYKQGRTEVIDIIEDAVVGADPFEAVCQANVLKYTLRYRHKNGVEDLKKAVWYAEKLIAHITQK